MNKFMKSAIDEARKGIEAGDGGPFGSVIVKGGVIIGNGHNEVVRRHDPTCHGEIMAIRDACRKTDSFDLSNCELYTTAEPCPMCKGAIQWANISRVYYGCTITDTEKIGFRDKLFYNDNEDISEQTDREECLRLFDEYASIQNKIIY